MQAERTQDLFSLERLDLLSRPGARVETRDERYFAGCWVRFDNGWTISIQWGNGNYSDNYRRDLDEPPQDSSTAEVAAWKGECSDMVTWWDGDTVQGYVSMERVQQILDLAAEGKLLRPYQPPVEHRAYAPGDEDPQP